MFRKVTLFVFIAGLVSSIALAQNAPATTPDPSMMPDEAPAAMDATVIASELNNPRHLFYEDDGTLYITEAGTGGDLDAQGPFGPVKAGLTGQISAVSPDGAKTVVVSNLVSINLSGAIEGATSVLVTDDSYWVTLGRGPQEPIADGALAEAVVEYDRQSGEVKQVIDMRAFEEANNPDGSQELISNPADLALSDDGTLYIVDASGNSFFSWTADGGLKLLASWPTSDTELQAVPTSVAIGPDGDLYIGFLSGYPFPAGGARIERLSPDGTLKETYDNLTLVTDVLVTADGTLYAVQLANGYSDLGDYNANTGSIIKVSADGVEPVVEGLNYPYGLAQNSDGQLVVTVDSAFLPADSGQVIAVGM